MCSFFSGLLLEINVISVFMGHQLKKEDELLVANVIEGEQIQFLEGFFSSHDAVPSSSEDDRS